MENQLVSIEKKIIFVQKVVPICILAFILWDSRRLYLNLLENFQGWKFKIIYEIFSLIDGWKYIFYPIRIKDKLIYFLSDFNAIDNFNLK